MPTEILQALHSLAPKIYQAIKKGDTSYTEGFNPTADRQLAIDIALDTLIFQTLMGLSSVGGVMSEEREEAHYKDLGEFLVAFDPLDGSSVVGANFLVGSIFSIYARTPLGFKDSQIGQKIQMAAYILYGAKLELVISTHQQVQHELYDECQQIWVKKGTLKLQEKGKNIAPGGSWQYFTQEYKAFLDHFFKQGYRLRYSGSMVADVHHLLTKEGGIFCYPSTHDAPQGKLRKLFEVYPLAFIIENAGGEGSNGNTRLLSTSLESLHAKSPCFLGSKVEMQVLPTWQNHLKQN
ncbi:class 1 fructose-bisphosphatase [Helicobacter suis]|uniref:class 1 fructose-bisphosphatase n=1 Tax=Helicobacter suis TaxID=104628 RepID=UPI001F074882|nr:class 1 fructose-bisphosphatase [Helicobacter suis]